MVFIFVCLLFQKIQNDKDAKKFCTKYVFCIDKRSFVALRICDPGETLHLDNFRDHLDEIHSREVAKGENSLVFKYAISLEKCLKKVFVTEYEDFDSKVLFIKTREKIDGKVLKYIQKAKRKGYLVKIKSISEAEYDKSDKDQNYSGSNIFILLHMAILSHGIFFLSLLVPNPTTANKPKELTSKEKMFVGEFMIPNFGLFEESR